MPKYEIVPANLHGDTCPDHFDRVYLNLEVTRNGEYMGCLTGWFPPYVSGLIHRALQSAAEAESQER